MGSSASKIDSYWNNLKSHYQVPNSVSGMAKIIEETSKFTVSVISSILESNKGIMNDQELHDVVLQFFSYSISMSELCNEIESCLDRARDSQLNLRAAVKLVKVGSGDGANRSEKYKLPLEELEKFKNSGDPFTGLFEKLEKVQQQEKKLSEKVMLYQDKHNNKKIMKKQEIARMARIAVGVICISLILAIVTCQVYVAVSGIILTPGSIGVLQIAYTATISTWGALDSLCKKYYDGLKRQQDLVSLINRHRLIEISNFEEIKIAAEKAGNQLHSLKRVAEFTQEGEEQVKIGLEEIEKKMDKYVKSLEDLGKCVENCSEHLKKGREEIKKKLFATE